MRYNILLNSSFVSDAIGYATQHLQYLPYGETFVDQHGAFDSRYTFSAKEKDDETQYSYFGARYYDSDLSVWLSVDPLSDEYPHQSPYMYCSGNPVMRVDMTGMNDGWVEDNWDICLKQDGSIDVTWINGYGGSDVQIINFSRENSTGGHVQTGGSMADVSTGAFKTAANRIEGSSSSYGNAVKTASKINTYASIAISAAEQTVKNTQVGANFAYAISGNSKAISAVSNTFRYTPYVGLGVTILTGAYLSSEIDPATGRPYQSLAETGTDIGANIATIYIGTQYGGWWGAGAAAFYVADKAAFKWYINTVREHPEYFEGIPHHWR